MISEAIWRAGLEGLSLREMERAYAQRMIDMIDEYFNSLPASALIEALETHHAETVDALVHAHSESVVLSMRKERWLTDRWVESSERVEQIENTHKALIAATFVKSVGGRRDVRELAGDHSCDATDRSTGEYCGEKAVAQVMSQGMWRNICQTHLERLPPERRA